jgi:hypothetical protein
MQSHAFRANPGNQSVSQTRLHLSRNPLLGGRYLFPVYGRDKPIMSGLTTLIGHFGCFRSSSEDLWREATLPLE